MNFTLQVGPNWASQISAIRNKVTEDTNLIRFDNTFYRVCRDSDEQFAITLLPQDTQQRSLLLHLSMRNLYVNLIGGHGMGRYTSTLESQQLTLDGALGRLLGNSTKPTDAARSANGDEARSVIVWCIAESLRFSPLATAVGQAIFRSRQFAHGMSPELPIAAFDRLVKNWANTSDAIFNALSDEAKSIALQPRASLSPEQRQFSESVRPSTVHPDYQNFAQAVTVLNRPTRK
ncbi:hypothetical protein [Burkholderia anthina]|uniref:hypothetical protein n=1 Tax=Burkholderia anthina TaxID=179879 RepID=UPI00158BA8F8|nr:hypothetical protein [Burkholderia anthina]